MHRPLAYALLAFLLAMAFLLVSACGDDGDDSSGEVNMDDDDDAVADDDDASDDDDAIDDVDDDDDDVTDDDDDVVDDDDDLTDDDDDFIACDHGTNRTLESAEIHIFDIPEGNAVWVSISGYDILINSGASDNLDKIKNYLADQGLQSLEEIVLASVADEDIGEMEELIDEYGVDLVRKTPAESATATYLSLMDKIDDLGAPVEVLSAGDTIDNWIGQPELVLSPPDPIPANFSDKDASLVLKIGIGEVDMILPFSISSIAENWMINTWEDELCAELLVASDHGSGLGTSDPWLYSVQPDAVFIIASFRNPWGYPDSGTAARIQSYGAETYRTMDEGTMKVVSNGYFYEIICGT